MTNKYQPIKDLIHQGKRAEARAALEAIVRADPNDADAWYGLSQVNDDPAQKEYCLQRAYALRPDLTPKRPREKRKTPIWVYGLLIIFIPLLLCLCSGMLNAVTQDPSGGSSIQATQKAPAAVELSTSTVAVITLPPTWTSAPVAPTDTATEIISTRFLLPTSPPPSLTVELRMPAPPVYDDALVDVCDCSSDLYNCNDFPNSVAAQYCFSYCRQKDKGDIHNLDGDGDGRACEF